MFLTLLIESPGLPQPATTKTRETPVNMLLVRGSALSSMFNRTFPAPLPAIAFVPSHPVGRPPQQALTSGLLPAGAWSRPSGGLVC